MSEQLKYKMNAYEATPPGDAWNNIREQLNEQIPSNILADKLYPYEVTPPEAAWQHILDGLTPVKDISIRKARVVHPARWMAAAVVTALLLAGTYYFINSGSTDQDRIADVKPLSNPDEQQKIAAVTPQITASHTLATVRRTLASLYTTKKSSTDNKERPLRSISVDEDDIQPITEELSIDINPRQILNEKGELIQDMSVVNPLNNKYISITAPNGQQTKISSKLAIAMRYLSSNGAANQGESTDTDYWMQLISEWRAKIMQSSLVPSSSNFMDILEFSELIKE